MCAVSHRICYVVHLRTCHAMKRTATRPIPALRVPYLSTWDYVTPKEHVKQTVYSDGVMLAIQGKAHFANPDARAKHVASRRRQLMHAGHGTHRPSQIGLRARCSLQPQLANIPTSAIRSRIGVSRWYAGRIRQGYRPVPVRMPDAGGAPMKNRFTSREQARCAYNGVVFDVKKEIPARISAQEA